MSSCEWMFPPVLRWLAFLFPLLVFAPGNACGECVFPRWSVSYDGPISSGDMVHGVAVDASGNVVACGYERDDYSSSQPNWLIRKCTPTGELLWSRTYAGTFGTADEASSAAVDASGNVIVAGWYTYDGMNQYINWMTRKYDGTGSLLWSVSYDGAGHQNDLAYSVAVDSSNNIIVGGYETATGQGYNWLIFKYDPSGGLVWSRSYNSPANNNDVAYGVAVDGSGNVTAAGYENRPDLGQGYNWLVRKFDAGGDLLWSRTYNGPANMADVGRAVAVDASGNEYVAGYEQRSAAGINYRWMIRKYDPGGALLWSRTYGSAVAGGDNKAYSVAVDSGGSVYVAGYEDRSDLGQNLNWLVRKYDADGSLLWSESYNSPANDWDAAEGVAVGANGDVVVAGSEYRPDLGQSANWRIREYRQAACPEAPVQKPPVPSAGGVWVSGTGGRLPVSPKSGERFVFSLNPKKAGRVHAVVYSLMWEEIMTVFDGDAQAGPLELRWDGRNKKGQTVAAGTYVVKFELPGENPVVKRVVIRK